MRHAVVCPKEVGGYQMAGTIGEGAFGLVKLAYNPKLDIYCACKIIPRGKLQQADDSARFEQEIRLLQQLRHPRIVQLYDLRLDDRNIYVMQEYCPNGALIEYILKQRRIDEHDAQIFFRQVLEGMLYIHGQHIAHRDLKPENILVDADGAAKICDFGLAKYVGEGGITDTPCGSPLYVAPEILSDFPYDPKCADCWSLGVLLFAMVTGMSPWRSRNRVQLFAEIRRGEYAIPASVSTLCGDLIRKLMNLNVVERYTVEQALQHAWLSGDGPIIPDDKMHPLVSLRRLDWFFARDVAISHVRIPARPRSTGRLRTSFSKEEELISPEKASRQVVAPQEDQCVSWMLVKLTRKKKKRRKCRTAPAHGQSRPRRRIEHAKTDDVGTVCESTSSVCEEIEPPETEEVGKVCESTASVCEEIEPLQTEEVGKVKKVCVCENPNPRTDEVGNADEPDTRV